MEYKIIGDSCCDFNREQLEDRLHFQSVPLQLEIGDYHIADDAQFHQKDFLGRMRTSSVGAKTACPSPEEFKLAMNCGAEMIFVVTLSEHLSGSYQSAVLGKQLYEEEYGVDHKKILIIPSNSAAAGQYRLVVALERMCKLNFSFEQIKEKIFYLRNQMKTYFVLESLETLRKNGRLSGLSAFFASTLNIKPIMGASEGKIIKLDQARGMNRALAKMAEIATKEGENLPEKILCITHVNCPERAQFVADHFKAMGICKEIFITEAMGVSTIYAGDGGIVIGFV